MLGRFRRGLGCTNQGSAYRFGNYMAGYVRTGTNTGELPEFIVRPVIHIRVADLHAWWGLERHLEIPVPSSALTSWEYEYSCKWIIGSGAIPSSPFSPHDAAFLEET